MPVTMDNLFYAYQWASGADGDNEAYIDRTSGEVHVTGDYADDDIPVPDDLDDETKYIKAPDSYALDLSTALVFRFAAEKVPELRDEIRTIFARKGAYRRFKNMLADHDRLDLWHKYEQQETEAALIAWCAQNGIELTS